MASSQASSSSGGAVSQEYAVRVPKETRKKFSLMKFNSAVKVDFAKENPVKIERENNFKEYKSANDLETMPKFGAGSEFGREQKEEARRKKYGIMLKKYNPDDQPWMLKLGSGKQAKRFKGLKEGTITENTSYYIFTQGPDGAFEAFPVDEWYKFTSIAKYKHLNAEEAEEQYTRRDRTLNFFSIMWNQRKKNEEEVLDLDELKKKKKSKKEKKTKKDFNLTELDEWADLSESDDEDSESEEAAKKKPKEKKTNKYREKPKKKNRNSDDEALEESDDGDYDDREVDYMTDSTSEESDDGRAKNKYSEKGVVDEEGLKDLNESGSEEEEEKKPEEEQEKGEEEEKGSKKGSGSSSSSSSDSESDIEKEGSLLFLQKKSGDKKKSSKRDGSENNSASNSRSATPTANGEQSGKGVGKKSGKKRKPEDEGGAAKKPRLETPPAASATATAAASSGTPVGNSEGITEENVKRYLMRRPMTIIDLLQKFKNKKLGMTNEQMTTTVAQILKRINPDKNKVKGKLYLSIKKS